MMALLNNMTIVLDGDGGGVVDNIWWVNTSDVADILYV